MQTTEINKTTVSFHQKIVLVVLGILIFTVFLEGGLRLGGFILLSLQEYRNINAIRQKGTYRIMCLGESTTALGDRNSYPSQLEETLNQRNIGIKFSVINKGLTAVDTSRILMRLEDNLDQCQPDMVIAMMGINDGGDHLPYDASFYSRPQLFLKSLRIYKLSRLLWLHVLHKAGKLYPPKLRGEERDVKQQRLSQIEEDVTVSNKSAEQTSLDDKEYVDMGKAYMGRGDFVKAEKPFMKAIELNPMNDQAYAALAVQYSYLGKFSQAEEMFKRNIEVSPGNDAAYIGLAFFYSNYLGKFSQAEGSFKKAIELKSFNCDIAYGGLALVYNEMGRIEPAEECYKKANELRLWYYKPVTRNNYLKLREILDKRRVRLVCAQYPVRSIAALKQIFEDQKGVIFVDNEKVFKDMLKKASYKEYFKDMFGGEFGHCTPKGNRLLAGNIANVILKEVFKK